MGGPVRIYLTRIESLAWGILLFLRSGWYVLPVPGYGRYKICALAIQVVHPCNVKVTKFEVPPSCLLGICFKVFVFTVFHSSGFPRSLAYDFGHSNPKLFPDYELVIR